MAKDYARKSRGSGKKGRATASRKPAAGQHNAVSPLSWFVAGLVSGVLLSFLAYLVLLTPGTALPPTEADATGVQPETPRPRFDFYTRLQEQTLEPEPATQPSAPSDNAAAPPENQTYYLLQAGSFRQEEDADRRRAELLLLGLEPRVERAEGGNGLWYRVYLGPYESRAAVNRARGLTAGQDIETLLLKRSG